MLVFVCLLLDPGQLPTQRPADFPAELQVRALAGTVRVYNPLKKTQGSGVIVGRTGGFVYILTAHHIVTGADGVEITVFTEKSDPKAHKVYRGARVIAKAADARDLALVRLQADDKTLSIVRICPRGATPKADGFPALALGCSADQGATAVVYDALSKKKIRRKADTESAYFWESAGAVVKGRSGGPLIDQRGFVIGICSGANDGKGYYTHTEEIHRFLKQNAFDWLADEDAGGAR